MSSQTYSDVNEFLRIKLNGSLLSNARHRSPGAAAFDLKAAGFDFSPAWREPDKSFPDKIRQQLQVLRDLNLLEFLGSGSS